MLAITAAQVRAAALSRANEANLNSVMVSLDRYAADLGMNKPHIMAQFFAQIMHDFRSDCEIWGPSPAPKGYDKRTDLGNSPAADGDGYLYRGRTAMQLTGKSNYRQFRDWCRGRGYNPPDFVASPDLVNTDPWEGLVPLWYWESRNLNKWANEGDIETLTKKINGGKNGLADRMNRYGRVALVLLGYRPDNVRQFQADHRLEVDGDVGPKTRAALHQALVALVPGEAEKPEVKAAPVVEEKTVVEEKPVAVTPPSLDAPWWRSKEILVPAAGGGIATTLNALGGIPWQNLLITLAFISAAGAFLYWRKHSDAKAVGKKVETMAVTG